MGCLMKINGIKGVLSDIRGELTCGVRRLCLRPSPGVRLLIIITLFVVLSATNIWFVVSSIYNAGKRDARKEFLKIEHAGKLELQHKSDSVKTIKRIEFKFKKIEN
jgi:hypothetical protein